MERTASATWPEEATRLLRGRPFEEHWAAFAALAARRPPEEGPLPAWVPDEATRRRANAAALEAELGLPAGDFAALHRWSVQERAEFWDRMRRRVGLGSPRPAQPALATPRGVEDPDWFPDERWNAAAACFRGDLGRTALLVAREDGTRRAWTLGELQRQAARVSNGLLRRGLRAGDAVALYLPMTAECVAAYLGIVQAGLAVVSVPDSFAAPEVATRLRLGNAKAVVTVASFARGGKVVAMLGKAQEAAGELPCIVVGAPDAGGGARGGAARLRPHDVRWEDLLADDDGFEAPALPPTHLSNILFSSGTTGEPKAIPWTHLTPLKAAADGWLHQDIHPDDVVAWPTNVGWMMGPWLIYASLLNGATMAVHEGLPTGRGFLDFVRAAGVTVLGVVPAIVRAWRAGGLAAPGDLPGVRVFSSTGEASNAEDYLYLMSLAGYRAPVIEYCGGTEIGGGHVTGSVLQPQSPATFSTPAMGLDFVVLGEDGREVPAGGLGELYLIPPSVGLSQRLLNRDHHEEYYAGCPRGPRGEVLRRHGDEVRRLGAGYWSAQGRADDTMNLGGIKVSSVELERVVDAVPGVRESACIGVPPAGGGADRLVAFVVPRSGSPPPDAAALRDAIQQAIKARLNPLYRVHEVVLLDALPRTASNKVMRRTLRAQHQRGGA